MVMVVLVLLVLVVVLVVLVVLLGSNDGRGAAVAATVAADVLCLLIASHQECRGGRQAEAKEARRRR